MNEIKPFTDAYSIHLYCEHCGKELNKELYSTNSFDKKTGKEIYNLKVICLNKKHWWDWHTSEWITFSYSDGTNEYVGKEQFDKNGNEI